MAKICRLTLAFSEPSQGWSENWYFQRDDPRLIDLLDEFENLKMLRAKLLGTDASLIATRVSIVQDTVTGVRTPRLSLPRSADIKGDPDNALCAPHDSLLVRCITGDQMHKKVVYLGGVWIDIFDRLRHYSSVNGFQTLLDNWAAEVKARGLGWLSQTRDQSVDVTEWSTNVDTGRTVLTLSGPITFSGEPPVRRVSVTYPGGHEALEGVYLVGPNGAVPNSVLTTKPRPSHAFDGRIGSLKTYKYDLVTLGPVIQGAPASHIEGQRMARRNRGKALYSEVGRRGPIIRW